MVDILFSAPVISCLLVAGCAAFGVSVVVSFVPDKRKLDHTLSRAEKALGRLREEIAAKEGTIAQLQAEVEMLKPVHTRLNSYHEDLTQLRLDLERQEMADGEKKPDADDDEDEVFGRRKRFKV
jgi:chromosome segregation ATPase